MHHNVQRYKALHPKMRIVNINKLLNVPRPTLPLIFGVQYKPVGVSEACLHVNVVTAGKGLWDFLGTFSNLFFTIEPRHTIVN